MFYQYKVTATNPIGTAENKFELKILQTVPTFDKSLPRFLEVDDEVLQLKCKVTGSPKPEIKWLKDGEPLLPGENVKIIEESDGSAKLLVSDFTPEKSGTYTVVAENPNGKVVGQCAVSAQRKFFFSFFLRMSNLSFFCSRI